jgi:hypothetical protein
MPTLLAKHLAVSRERVSCSVGSPQQRSSMTFRFMARASSSSCHSSQTDWVGHFFIDDLRFRVLFFVGVGGGDVGGSVGGGGGGGGGFLFCVRLLAGGGGGAGGGDGDGDAAARCLCGVLRLGRGTDLGCEPAGRGTSQEKDTPQSDSRGSTRLRVNRTGSGPGSRYPQQGSSGLRTGAGGANRNRLRKSLVMVSRRQSGQQ